MAAQTNLFCLTLLSFVFSTTDGACTSIIVTPAASASAAAMTSHTADCAQCDFRISKVPASSHLPGAKRPIFDFRLEYPRYIGKLRGPTYYQENVDSSIYPWRENQGPFAPMGEIDEVGSTFGYIDGIYGMMNEKGVAMGESTCTGIFTATPVSQGGKALMNLGELTRLAMERSDTALSAVKLMGGLAEKFGYYGADNSKAEAGESLQVCDALECWVFQILPDDTGTSALWVAKRVPDGHVTVVANAFTIRANWDLSSENIYAVALRAGLWTGRGQEEGAKLDFAATYGFRGGHKSTYHTRRMWRVLTRVAPSVNLSPDADFWPDYPFSVAAERQLSVLDVAELFRDHYEGTQFDLTQGLQAGPYGDPARFDAGGTEGVATYPEKEHVTAEEGKAAFFERAISLFRTSISWVSESRAATDKRGLDVVWFGPYAPHATTYIPVYPLADSIPSPFTVGHLMKYDDASSYWAHASVANYAARFYVHTIGDLRAASGRHETKLLAAQSELERRAAAALAAGDARMAGEMLANYSNNEAVEDVVAWHRLLRELFVKYKDGQMVAGPFGETLNPVKLFYPRSWLTAAGFWPEAATTSAAPASPALHPKTDVGAMLGIALVVGAAGVLAFVAGRLVERRSHRGNRVGDATTGVSMIVAGQAA